YIKSIQNHTLLNTLIHTNKFLSSLSFLSILLFFFFNDTATTEIYTLSLHDALPISAAHGGGRPSRARSRAGSGSRGRRARSQIRSEEHTSELQSRGHLVCRLLLEKKKKKQYNASTEYFFF